MPHFSLFGSPGAKARLYFAALSVAVLVSLSFYARAQQFDIATREDPPALTTAAPTAAAAVAPHHDAPSPKQPDETPSQATRETSVPDRQEISPLREAQQEEQESKDKALVLTLRPTGFEPSEVSVTHGKYLLVVSNRTGLDGFALHLDRQSEGRVLETRPPRFKRRWRGMVNLSPGGYVLTEAEHPEWSCRITVSPR